MADTPRPRGAPAVHGRRSGSRGEPGRRARWDSDEGITRRDITALRWLGEQYAARSDVLRVLLGRLSPGTTKVPGLLGEETLRDALDRWEARDLAFRERLFSWVWAFPTARALRLVGLDVPVWLPVATRLEHVHAAGIVRLALEPRIPAGGRWLSERQLRRDRGRTNVPDAAIQLPDHPEDHPASKGLYGEAVHQPPERIAVEVELTRKTITRLQERWTKPGRWAWTDYYAPPQVAGYLERQLARIQPRRQIRIHPLPEVPGTSYQGAR